MLSTTARSSPAPPWRWPRRARTRTGGARHHVPPLTALPPTDLRQGRALPPDPQTLARPPTPRRDPRRAASQLDTLQPTTTTPAGPTALSPPHARRGLRRSPKAPRRHPLLDGHYRLRHDRVHAGGVITLATTASSTTSASAAATPASRPRPRPRPARPRPQRPDGELLRELTLDPTRTTSPKPKCERCPGTCVHDVPRHRRWSPRRDSNPRPADYESAALAN